LSQIIQNILHFFPFVLYSAASINLTEKGFSRMKASARLAIITLVSALVMGATLPAIALAQSDIAREKISARSDNHPLKSLRDAAEIASLHIPAQHAPREIPNYRGPGRSNTGTGNAAASAPLQTAQGTASATAVGSGFPGASNADNGAILGYRIAPPDTDGAVGPNHFVQMINSITTVYDKDGGVVLPSFASNAFWAGQGGNCGPNNQGDPVVLYDDTNDRWLVSQFAFPDSQSTFSQCVAISQSGDPTKGYNRYEFSFDNIGLNDYPKHGIVNNSITMIANIFTKRGKRFSWGGTYLGVMDKAAMYAGQPANIVGFNIGTGEFGFVAGDLDGGGSAPALFATAMTQTNRFDIWQLDIDWANQNNASVSRIVSLPVSAYSSNLCSASRGACIPQPNSGPALESLSDRLMHRLQIRDFGIYRTMVAAHTVDVGGGRAGIRWYELRQPSGGSWDIYQEGTFGPNDGEYRWMPSIAMNSAGDIGIGYMIASTNTFVSIAAAGQTTAGSGTGILDASETICAAGAGVQTGVNRSGDYSATSIDPINDSFWHTNEVFVAGGDFVWETFICEFDVSNGGGGNVPPNAAFSYACNGLTCGFTDASTDSDGSVTGWNWDFGDGNTSTAQNPGHTYAAAGTYTVGLTATDDGAANGSTSQQVTVVDPNANVPPTASFTSSCTDLDCNFTDGSSDPGGSVTGWSWNFGDGNTSTAQNPSHSYTNGGTYSVSLTVTDNEAATGGTSQNVTVSSGGETLTPSSANNGKTWTATVTSSASSLTGTFDGVSATCNGNTCSKSGIAKKTGSVTFVSSTGASVVVFK
jgi:PKD repeat protein